jgi:uncharacterized protein YacL
MAGHMKTTVVIPDALLADIQKIAAKNKTTFRALVQEGLLHVIEQDQKKKKPKKIKDCSFGDPNEVWGLEGMSWEEIRAVIYEGRGE